MRIEQNWRAFLRTVESNKEDDAWALVLALLVLCPAAILIIVIVGYRFA